MKTPQQIFILGRHPVEIKQQGCPVEIKQQGDSVEWQEFNFEIPHNAKNLTLKWLNE